MSEKGALKTWRNVKAEFDIGTVSLLDESRARVQYFEFLGAAEEAQSTLFTQEGNLRFIMGVAATDGRLIRPADEPTTARVRFDWCDSHTEAMIRNVHVSSRALNRMFRCALLSTLPIDSARAPPAPVPTVAGKLTAKLGLGTCC